VALTAGRLAERLEATLRGEPGVEIHSVASLETAGPGQVAFLVNPRYRPHLRSTRASAVILAPEDVVEGVACLVTSNPYLAFARAVEILHGKDHPRRGVEGGARVHPGARVADGATVMAGACVEDGAEVGAGSVLYPGAYVGPGARVGRDCVLHPNAVVREGCVLGERVILQPGAVVGSDGFGYARDGARAVKIPQVGIAVLEDDVEVGACAAIDRAALGETRVGRGTKIDNLVQVAHNVSFGRHNLVMGQCGFAGSTRLGDYCVIASQSGIAGHLSVGAQVTVGAKSGVMRDLPAQSTVLGIPALPDKQFKRQVIAVQQLPELIRRVRELERQLSALRETAGD
jgi:UDP-3-O-[3-hydroxymyristoyl] glucosamine N-acyltransferase